MESEVEDMLIANRDIEFPELCGAISAHGSTKKVCNRDFRSAVYMKMWFNLREDNKHRTRKIT